MFDCEVRTMKYVEFGLKKSVVPIAFALFSGVLTSGLAVAQQSSDGAGIPTPPGAVRMGPLVVYPSVRYEVLHDDNVLLQAPGSGQVKSDTLQVLTPQGRGGD